MKLPDYLKQLAAFHRMTHRQLACYLGIPYDTFRKWVTGRTNPSASLLRLLVVMELIGDQLPELERALVETAKSDCPGYFRETH